MAVSNGTIKDIVSSLKTDTKVKNSTYQAEVTRIDKQTGVAYVRLAGSDRETPTELTAAEVKKGDSVTVEWRNNKLYIGGNYSSPSVGTQRILIVEKDIGTAQQTADTANETAKTAKKTADTAKQIADNTDQYFWHTETGTDTGAHITEIPKEDFEADPTNGGGNLLARSNGIAVRDGLTELATFGASGAQIGQSGAAHSVIDANGQRFYASDGSTELANIGYGEGAAESGTAIAPYYTFGVRSSSPTVGNYSVAEGYEIFAGAAYSHAEGCRTRAEGKGSHAEGIASSPEYNTASGRGSHVEGRATTASGDYSHAEGFETSATDNCAHAEGSGTTASGLDSHAEGSHTTSSGDYSHAEGSFTTAAGNRSHAQNDHTTAGYSDQTVIGSYNDNKSTNAFEIGNGTSSTPSNAFEVEWSGNIEAAGDITVGGHSSPIGSRLSAVWTASSSSASGTAMTGDITLTPGVWMLGMITPTCSATKAYYFSNISSTLTYPYFTMGTGGSGWVPVEITTNTTTHIASGAATACNYSNLTCGRILAVRIA